MANDKTPDLNACPRCHGAGWYPYDHNHAKPCEVCCRHDQGWWPLTEDHGKPGHWACLAGCGETRDYDPDTSEGKS